MVVVLSARFFMLSPKLPFMALLVFKVTFPC
jgi:hypothetical protein